MPIQRAFPSILSDKLVESKQFYISLLDLTVTYESDWFIHLQAKAQPALELGILKRTQDLIPKTHQSNPQGTLITWVVDDVDEIYAKAMHNQIPIIEPPTNQPYGQRRLLLTDPNNALLDISSECEPSEAFLASLKS